MAAYTIPAPLPLELNTGNLASNWNKFQQRYENFEIATGVNNKPDAKRVATLLSVIGQEAVDLYNSFEWDTAGDDKKFDPVIAKFKSFCTGRKNLNYERFLFGDRAQKAGESVEAFVTALRTQADECEFGEQKESMILTRLTLGIRDIKIKQKLMNTDNLTVEKALKLTRTYVATMQQVTTMSTQKSEHHDQVNTVKHRSKQRKQQQSPRKPRDQSASKPKRTCYFCGGNYPHSGECPAQGKTCHFCGTLNHLAKVCRKKQRQQTQSRPHDPHSLNANLSQTKRKTLMHFKLVTRSLNLRKSTAMRAVHTTSLKDPTTSQLSQQT